MTGRMLVGEDQDWPPRCCDWPMWPHLDLDLFVCLLCGRQLTRHRWVDPGLIIAAGGLGR
jgi:hypothetical protein